jgi:hypothetical protein
MQILKRLEVDGRRRAVVEEVGGIEFKFKRWRERGIGARRDFLAPSSSMVFPSINGTTGPAARV